MRTPSAKKRKNPLRAAEPIRQWGGNDPLRMVGLFAGVGGLELGLSRAGHQTQLLCEIEPGAKAVLAHHFPDAQLHSDICTLPALPEGTELVTAGFPCQDLSQAGKTAGIDGLRSGLVREVFRLIANGGPSWVLLENVPFMLQLSRGAALEVIVAEFERLGYRWAYRVVDTRAFGIPQRRERVFFLASRDYDPRTVLFADEAGPPLPAAWNPRKNSFGFYWTEGVRGLGAAIDAVPTLKGGSTIGIPSPPAILLPQSHEVVKPDIRDAERLQGFTPGWTEPALAVAKRGSRWKLVGNAVTVDVAAWIGRRLREPGTYDASRDLPLPRGTAWPRAAHGSKSGRFKSMRSAYPVRAPLPPVHSFLKFPAEPLSARATAGFLTRTRSGTLRFPPGFIDAVEAHLDSVSTSLTG